jgi:rhodanese-related sulfurtransferase
MGISKKRTGAKGRLPRRPYFMVAIAGVAILLVLIGASALLINNDGTSPNSTLPQEISVEQAYQARESGAFILDVRTQEEWNEFHMPDSTLIPLDELENRINEVPREREIVVVCRSGNRSQQGRDILLNANFSNVASMAGGLNEWRAAGYPTVSGP